MNAAAYATFMEAGEHPVWCARGHHCSAQLGGRHASEQYILRGPRGSVIITRYQPAGGGTGTVQVRLVVRVPEGTAAGQAAWLTGLSEAVWAAMQTYPGPPQDGLRRR